MRCCFVPSCLDLFIAVRFRRDGLKAQQNIAQGKRSGTLGEYGVQPTRPERAKALVAEHVFLVVAYAV